MVGVVKEKLYALPSVFLLTAFAVASMVTSNFVANGSFGAGVKMSVVVPDQRNAPFTAGAMWNHGTTRFFGIFPTATIGSLKTTRTSLASARLATSPTGPAFTTVSLSAAWRVVAKRRRKASFIQRAWYSSRRRPRRPEWRRLAARPRKKTDREASGGPARPAALVGLASTHACRLNRPSRDRTCFDKRCRPCRPAGGLLLVSPRPLRLRRRPAHAADGRRACFDTPADGRPGVPR